MSRREVLRGHEDGAWHRHICRCGLHWICSKPDCRNTDDCTSCEMQQQEDHFRARGDSAEQLEIPRAEQ